jgi:hypothetical protein
VTAEPTAVPPAEQSGFETRLGPQTKKETVPLTIPFGPASVARSVIDWPSEIDAALDCVVKVAGTGATAAAANERSMLPSPPLSRSSRRMWYGEPEIEPAALPRPQSICEAMWPPQASSTVELVAVNVTTTERLLAGSLLPYAMFVIVPFQIEIEPGACVELELAKAIPVSSGIGNEEPPAHGEMPEHGAAVVSVRLYEVR